MAPRLSLKSSHGTVVSYRLVIKKPEKYVLIKTGGEKYCAIEVKISKHITQAHRHGLSNAPTSHRREPNTQNIQTAN